MRKLSEKDKKINIQLKQIPMIKKADGHIYLNQEEYFKLKDRISNPELDRKLSKFQLEFNRARGFSQQSSQPILLTFKFPNSEYHWAQFIIDDYRVFMRDKSDPLALEYPILIEFLLDEGQIGVVNLKEVLFETSRDNKENALLNCISMPILTTERDSANQLFKENALKLLNEWFSKVPKEENVVLISKLREAGFSDNQIKELTWDTPQGWVESGPSHTEYEDWQWMEKHLNSLIAMKNGNMVYYFARINKHWQKDSIVKLDSIAIQAPYFGSIEKETLENFNFRKVIFTGKYAQLVLMALQPEEAIGNEMHLNVDQFFRIEQGEANFEIQKSNKPTLKYTAKNGDAVLIPAGTWHNVRNISKGEILKLYTIYSPPNHPPETLQTKKPVEKH